MIAQLVGFGSPLTPTDRAGRVVRLSMNGESVGFPIAYVDRYTYISGMLIRTGAEQPVVYPGGGMALRFLFTLGLLVVLLGI